jgi:hypothetical protein
MVSAARAAFCVAALLAALTPLPAGARVRVVVDRDPVVADESFTATFTAEAQDGAEPDFAPLERDFEILGRSTQTSLQIVNGRAESRQSFVLTLIARRSGTLELPSIRFGSERSEPVTLEVRPAARGASADGDVFIVVEASPQPAYVQSQILVTVRLYLGVRVGNATLSELEAGGAVVEKLGDDRRREEQRGGRDYLVFERRYAVFAEQSGTLTLGAVQFAGEVLGRGAFGRYRRTASAPMDLEIRPVPPALDLGSWLPARALALTEQWPADPPEFREGEPLKRSLELRAVGLTAAQLPPLAGGATAGFKQYTDQPALEDLRSDEGITGVRRETIVMLPTQPGRYLLPGIEVRWWNTGTSSLEIARLPEREVEVLPGAPAAAPPPAPAAETAPAGGTATAGAAAQHSGGGTMSWAAASLVCAMGWLATVLLWWWSRRRAHSGSQRTAATTPAPGMEAASRSLREACARSDAAAARQALMAWAHARWPGTGAQAWPRLCAGAGPALRAEIAALDRALYAAHPRPWSGSDLWRSFLAEAPAPAVPRGASEALAPLHP